MSVLERERAQGSLVQVFRAIDKWGMGFVTIGGFVVTAAHCLPRRNGPIPIIGRDVPVRKFGDRDRVGTFMTLASYELCADLAVLAPTEATRALLASRTEAPLRLGLRSGEQVQVEFQTADRRWISRMVKVVDSPSISLILEQPSASFTSGTSGSPTFDDGRVVGIVQARPDQGLRTSGCIVLLETTLPGWILARIKQGANRSNVSGVS